MKVLYWNLIEASNDNVNWVKIKKFPSFKTFHNKKLKSNKSYKYWKITRWKFGSFDYYQILYPKED